MSQHVITFIGPTMSGKSTLLHQYMRCERLTSYTETIDDEYNSVIKTSCGEYEVRLNDCSGNENYSMLRDDHILACDTLVYVFSLTDHASFIKAFSEVVDCLNLLFENREQAQKPKFVLVATKKDVNNRSVTSNECSNLSKFAQGKVDCTLWELSSFDQSEVDALFQSFVGDSQSKKSLPKTPVIKRKSPKLSQSTSDVAEVKKLGRFSKLFIPKGLVF
ncbi:hypothetical protein EIN_429640 [Entamoeba invadens IP1]|uniref:Uncharacterized protein n=1 Tax=Entamoeba invadens IP1 TaxID=370355 RepID=A0A0A1UFC2_ENTIV|nr:hypothetical protein EIN_429640 [Entamoeba invadens IP1]ELP95188.1 hypothetical protein EIN_429640 [Entamoeba invadens IP1]|eukprot:XP_004261959.1 hypothetical protein EIN_429640 [Entamoeba invadens IP1]